MLDDGKVEDGQLRGDDATPDSLSPALSLSAAIPLEAGITRLHEQVHPVLCEDTLLHGEALLVLPTHDLEDIPLELLQAMTL